MTYRERRAYLKDRTYMQEQLMETSREITIIDLAKLVQLPKYYMTITTHNDEHTYKVCSIEVCTAYDYNKGNIFFTNLDGDDPIDTDLFCLDRYQTMYTQPGSTYILIADKDYFTVATLEIKPVKGLPSIAKLLNSN